MTFAAPGDARPTAGSVARPWRSLAAVVGGRQGLRARRARARAGSSSRWRSRSGRPWPSPPSRPARCARTSARRPRSGTSPCPFRGVRSSASWARTARARRRRSRCCSASCARPSGGGRLLGEPLGSARARARVGYLPEHFAFHEWLTGRELLRFHGRLLGLGGRALETQIDALLAAGGARRRGRPLPARVQQGHEAAARPRAGPARRARDRLPRRAHLRPRPARPPASSAT